MLFPLPHIPSYHQPSPGPTEEDDVHLQWLGVAGYVLRWQNTTLLIDPYVTRASLARVAGGGVLEPDRGAIMRWVPRADWVVSGHSHYDHLADVPPILLRDGSRFIGSESSARVLRAAGVGEDSIHVFEASGGTLEAGDLEVTLVPSEHGRVLFGRIPYPGEIAADFPRRPCARDYRCGPVYGVLIRAGDVTIYHNGSAGLVDDELARHRADVVLLGLAGSKHTPDYVARVCGALEPRTLVPTHWDSFFSALDMETRTRMLPVVDFPRFLREAACCAPAAEVVIPDRLQSLRISQQGRVYAAP